MVDTEYVSWAKTYVDNDRYTGIHNWIRHLYCTHVEEKLKPTIPSVVCRTMLIAWWLSEMDTVGHTLQTSVAVQVDETELLTGEGDSVGFEENQDFTPAQRKPATYKGPEKRLFQKVQDIENHVDPVEQMSRGRTGNEFLCKVLEVVQQGLLGPVVNHKDVKALKLWAESYEVHPSSSDYHINCHWWIVDVADEHLGRWIYSASTLPRCARRIYDYRSVRKILWTLAGILGLHYANYRATHKDVSLTCRPRVTTDVKECKRCRMV